MVKKFKVKDSGKRRKFKQGAVRDIVTGKGRYDLISPIAMQRLANHYENGATKYEDRNWEKGIKLSRFLDSMIRHGFEYLSGSRVEDHLAAVAWNALAFIQTEHWIELGELPDELNDVG